MKRFFLYGLIVQFLIVLASLIMRDWEIVLKGSFLIVVGLFLLGGVQAQGAGGWEFAGATQEEKDEVFAYRRRNTLKVLLFILPSVIAIGLYALIFGISLKQVIGY